MNKYYLTFRSLFALALLAGVFADPAAAAVRLPAVIGDHMVLQQKTDAPIWGWANPGEKVRVTASWDSVAVSGVADVNGRWKVSIKTPAAGGLHSIEIAGENTILLSDILVGEVWICSGQSNMQMALNFPKLGYAEPVLNHTEEIRTANHPRIRLFNVPYMASDKPVDDTKAAWRACSPESVGDFSAVGYFFGRGLQERLNVPIGLINASQGGSALESWVGPAVLRADPEYAPILSRYENALKNLPESKLKYQGELDVWKKLAPDEQAKVFRPMPPFGVHKFCAPSTLYNGMVNPLLPFSLRGVIFYQGEENAIWTTNYEKLFAAMIANWREVWNRPDLSFLFCQLNSIAEASGPPDPGIQQYIDWHSTPGEPASLTPENWARVQEAQLKTLRVPGTGMAVTMDVGAGHAPNKQEVARRLVLNAMAKVYGKDLVHSGPVYRSMKTAGGKAVISFEPLQSPLASSDGKPLVRFTVAGADRVFRPAQARIEGDTVVAWSDEVRDPVAARYAWANTIDSNLGSESGLPASPFRTDQWPAPIAWAAAGTAWKESQLFAAGLKHSDIALMPEGTPDDYTFFAQFRPTVVAWGDDGLIVLDAGKEGRAKLAGHFATYRKMGVRLAATNVFMLSPTNAYLEAHPEMQETICIDLWGEKIVPFWTKSWWSCTNNPKFQEHLLERMRVGLEAGANIVHLDDHAGTYACASWGGGCFCEHCQRGFRGWLEHHDGAAVLAAAGAGDLATLDLKAFLSKRGFADRAAFISEMSKGNVPVWNLFLDFQREAVTAFIQRMQAEAARIAGRPVAFGINTFNLIPVQLFEAHLVDFFANEIEHLDREDLIPPVAYRLGEAIGRPTFATAAGWDWVKVLPAKSKTRVRGWIAQSYAFGQYFMYAWKKWGWSEATGTHWLETDPEIFRPIFAFVSDNPGLFDGFENAASVGLLFDSAAATKNRWDVREGSKALLDAGVSYGLVVSGDKLLKKPLTREALDRFRVMVLPKDMVRIEEKNQLLASWEKSGGTLLARPMEAAALAKLPGRIDVQSPGRVWALPRVQPDSSRMVVHFLNRDYEAAKDSMMAKTAVKVTLAPAALGGPSTARSVRYFEPGVPPRELKFRQDKDGLLEFELPSLDLWGIAEIK